MPTYSLQLLLEDRPAAIAGENHEGAHWALAGMKVLIETTSYMQSVGAVHYEKGRS